MHPMKRIGEGSDSASVAKFLLTDESSWITGQILGVDGEDHLSHNNYV